MLICPRFKALGTRLSSHLPSSNLAYNERISRVFPSISATFSISLFSLSYLTPYIYWEWNCFKKEDSIFWPIEARTFEKKGKDDACHVLAMVRKKHFLVSRPLRVVVDSLSSTDSYSKSENLLGPTSTTTVQMIHKKNTTFILMSRK